MILQIIKRYLHLQAEVVCSKNSGQRNQMALEVIRNS